MQDSVIAACQDCGKRYRVPSNGRTFKCKACGGAVSAHVDEPSPPERSKVKPSRGQRAGVQRNPRSARNEPDEEGEVRPRRRKSGGKTWMWSVYAGVGLAAIGGVAFILSTSSDAGERKGEADLSKVLPVFDAAWNDGDIDALVKLIHPTHQGSVGIRLRETREHRNWTSGFEAIIESSVSKSTFEELGETGEGGVDTELAVHKTGDAAVVTRWQFNASNETWYCYFLDYPPPPVAERLDAFDAAWNSGNGDALRPFLQPDKVDKLLFAFAKVAETRAWENVYPKISERTTDPTAEELRRVGFTMRYKNSARALYETEYGELNFKWELTPAKDEWFITSIKPPR